MLADQRRQEAASRSGGIDLLSQLAAGLGKKDPFDGEEEKEEEEDEVVNTDRDAMGGFTGSGSSGSGMAGFTVQAS